MLTIILSALIGVSAGLGLWLGDVAHWGWCIFWGLLVFGACQAGTGWILRRRIRRLMEEIQGTMQAGQKKLQEKVNRWQVRPPGSLKQAQTEMERDQRVFIRQALEQTAAFEPYYLWSPLLRRQINTMRMQLYYQMKDFDEVDRLMPRCLFIEPVTAAMRMARMHVLKDAELDKFFERQVARLRYGHGAVLYSLYAWIALQRGDTDLAYKTLLRADSKMDNEIIKRNIEHLANNRLRQFSNAGLGDEWYVLGLEEPRIKTQRQRGPGGRRF